MCGGFEGVLMMMIMMMWLLYGREDFFSGGYGADIMGFVGRMLCVRGEGKLMDEMMMMIVGGFMTMVMTMMMMIVTVDIAHPFSQTNGNYLITIHISLKDIRMVKERVVVGFEKEHDMKEKSCPQHDLSHRDFHHLT